MIQGHKYWYHQIKQPDGSVQQTYIGKDSPETAGLIAAHKDPLAAATRDHLRRLAASALALGCHAVIPNHARVTERLHNHAFFRAGGMLVGTHCFLAYQNMFGISWLGGATTVDPDFASRNVSLALPDRVDTHAANESLKMGFVPNSDKTTYTKADEPDFDLDFVTYCGKTGDKPIHVPALNVTLQPLRFMEFSMQAASPAVLLTSRGPLVVNMPPPERYAVHKLLVYGERAQKQRTKATKDLAQAAALIDYLSQHDPGALQDAWSDLHHRGPGWRKRAAGSGRALQRAWPKLDVPF